MLIPFLRGGLPFHNSFRCNMDEVLGKAAEGVKRLPPQLHASCLFHICRFSLRLRPVQQIDLLLHHNVSTRPKFMSVLTSVD